MDTPFDELEPYFSRMIMDTWSPRCRRSWTMVALHDSAQSAHPTPSPRFQADPDVVMLCYQRPSLSLVLSHAPLIIPPSSSRKLIHLLLIDGITTPQQPHLGLLLWSHRHMMGATQSRFRAIFNHNTHHLPGPHAGTTLLKLLTVTPQSNNS